MLPVAGLRRSDGTRNEDKIVLKYLFVVESYKIHEELAGHMDLMNIHMYSMPTVRRESK
jgi:hypothetical protein